MAAVQMTDGREIITAPDAASAKALGALGWEPVKKPAAKTAKASK